MKLLIEHGDSIHLDDNLFSEETKRWCSSKACIIEDDEHLEKCWVAQLCKAKFGSRIEYEFIAEQIYDHYPTEDEIMLFMCKYDALRFSYVTIDEAWQLYDPPE